MNWGVVLQIINGLVVVIGIPALLNFFVGFGRRLEKLDSLNDLVRKEVLPDLKGLKEKMSFLEGRLSSTKESI